MTGHEAEGLKRTAADSLRVSFLRGEHQSGWLTHILLEICVEISRRLPVAKCNYLDPDEEPSL